MSLSPEVVEVLVEHHPKFLDFLVPRVGTSEAAEELLQAAFVKGMEWPCSRARSSHPRLGVPELRVTRMASPQGWRSAASWVKSIGKVVGGGMAAGAIICAGAPLAVAAVSTKATYERSKRVRKSRKARAQGGT